jgi:hypothetical protein
MWHAAVRDAIRTKSNVVEANLVKNADSPAVLPNATM